MKRREAHKPIQLTSPSGNTLNVKHEYSYKFESINELLNFINSEPAVTSNPHSDRRGNEDFTGTKSLKSALNLMKDGWEEGAQMIDKGLKEVLTNSSSTATRQRSVYDVVGGNASVPRYLQGVPTNMIRQVKKPVKQPIANINIEIAFSGSTSQKDLINSCIETLQKAVNLENAGTRVNLFLTILVRYEECAYCIQIQLKKSTERLNVLKLAFPSAHPSMLRRVYFAFCEHNEDLRGKDNFFYGYGTPVRGEKNHAIFQKALEG